MNTTENKYCSPQYVIVTWIKCKSIVVLSIMGFAVDGVSQLLVYLAVP